MIDDDLDLILDGGDKPEFDGKRPPLLTVLCILTFVGTGVAVLIGTFQYISYSMMESVATAFNENDLDNIMGNSYRWMKVGLIVTFVSAFIRLAGALFMWRLKKIGFYIYLLGVVMPLGVTVLSLGSGIVFFGFVGLIINAIFAIGFVVMYGLNYKYLK